MSLHSNASSNHMTKMNSASRHRQIYKYQAPWPLYSINWSMKPDSHFRLAIGSFIEDFNNKVQVIALDEEKGSFVPLSTIDHTYPPTKIMWIPDTSGVYPDLLATSGDYLRIWRHGENETRLECLLNNVSYHSSQNL